MFKAKGISFKVMRVGFRQIGLDLFRRSPGYHYVPNYHGRSAYKQDNLSEMPIFGEIARETIAHGTTNHYYDRLYTIYHALLNTRRVFGAEKINLAEVGVFKGGTSYFIAAVAQALGMTSATFFGFDTFEGHLTQDVDLGVDQVDRTSGFSDTDFEGVMAYLHEFNNVELYKGRFQETSKAIADRRFHFVHLDVNIYEVTAYCLEFFHQRLLSGAIVVVDDYAVSSCPGVKAAVDEFIERQPGYLIMPLLSGQGLLVKAER